MTNHDCDPERRRRQYVNLGLGELAATAVFVFAALRIGSPSEQIALWAALVPLLVILIQGGVFWLLARSWVCTAAMPRAVAAGYRAFRVLDPVLLAAGLVVALVRFPSGPIGILVVLVWLFGVVEYLNYFVVRLAYPVSRWLAGVTQRRTPQLMLDVRAAQG